MHFDDHDYSDLGRSFEFGSIKSQHIYNDLCFIKSIKLNAIGSIDITYVFLSRIISCDLRNPRELLENIFNINYVRDSAVTMCLFSRTNLNGVTR